MRGSFHFSADTIANPAAGAPSPTSITRVTWRYEFATRSFLTAPISWCIIRFLWRPYMAEALERASKIVMAEAASSPRSD